MYIFFFASLKKMSWKPWRRVWKNKLNPQLGYCLANKLINGWEMPFRSFSDGNKTDHGHDGLSA